MPELPEVETVRKGLDSLLAGRVIRAARVHLPRIVRQPDMDTFCALLRERCIERVRRRGKYLLIDLGEWTLVSHLRMEGRYGVFAADEDVAPHTHVRFILDRGEELRYRDVRQFGTMDLLPTAQLASHRGLAALGPEPLAAEFDEMVLEEKLQSRSGPIKGVLLDQSVVAGIGNIYADEILFAARVHPERVAQRLTRRQVRELVYATKRILAASIEQGGSSVKSYVDGFGEQGRFQYALHVYGREGLPCACCGNPVRKGRVAGRGTHVCVVCQTPPRGAQITS
ncbi:bifunctional DNA-formamidopyrimidine glycosylase/DNA-(apurinic or apyrimidinic site) lyase [Ferroacidibacillus organovorans]|uniref:Formamidopyrimidine-DNA glycosylase n=1 Tax=Ferroacidibacillus organovorans TaxID=1765683 RepID=A0A124IWD4_9BACL|nr:bifunctional DNA-formamidopyrimidine glycosylase/DNA-(apurinic or apyrimidinic site) lyase [Ferroacidibacillus organovorans]KUO97066.1 5-hydroxymethyluracil DNA glycosylase [Ferroacidibacillus organovorans]